jgi:hypothetical protein
LLVSESGSLVLKHISTEHRGKLKKLAEPLSPAKSDKQL